MPVTVWVRILGGDLVETAKDVVSDVNADMPAEYRPGSVVDRAGSIDWAAAGKTAGAIAGKGIAKTAGAMLNVGGPMVIMMVADWFLEGALAMLRTDAGKPAADALAKLGDVMLDVIAKVIRPMIPLLLRAIKAIYPVLTTILLILADLGAGAASALVPALELGADVLEAIVSLAGKIKRGIEGIGRQIGGAWALIHNGLLRIQRGIDGLVSGLVQGFIDLLAYVIDWIVGPIKSHLENLVKLWDEWIGRHLPDILGEEGLRHPFGYMWNDVWYEWGTGPLGEAPHAGGSIVQHEPTSAQLVAALGEYARANGGLARAFWAPA